MLGILQKTVPRNMTWSNAQCCVMQQWSYSEACAAGKHPAQAPAIDRGAILHHQVSTADITAELEATSQLVHHQSLQQAEMLQVNVYHSFNITVMFLWPFAQECTYSFRDLSLPVSKQWLLCQLSLTLRAVVQGIEKALSELSQQQTLVRLHNSSGAGSQTDAQPHSVVEPQDRAALSQQGPPQQQQQALPDQASGAIQTADVMSHQGLYCTQGTALCVLPGCRMHRTAAQLVLMWVFCSQAIHCHQRCSSIMRCHGQWRQCKTASAIYVVTLLLIVQHWVSHGSLCFLKSMTAIRSE